MASLRLEIRREVQVARHADRTIGKCNGIHGSLLVC
jgi:hypothetical protein